MPREVNCGCILRRGQAIKTTTMEAEGEKSKKSNKSELKGIADAGAGSNGCAPGVRVCAFNVF